MMTSVRAILRTGMLIKPPFIIAAIRINAACGPSRNFISDTAISGIKIARISESRSATRIVKEPFRLQIEQFTALVLAVREPKAKRRSRFELRDMRRQSVQDLRDE
jgi:hypothetical protein